MKEKFPHQIDPLTCYEQKEFDKLVQKPGDVNIVGRGLVLGNFSIKIRGKLTVGGAIKSMGSIDCRRGIFADHDIECMGSLTSCFSIVSKEGYIKSFESILAGESLIGNFIETPTFDVVAHKLKTRYLPYSRLYYAELPILESIKDDIMNEDLCWDELREISQPLKDTILGWDGWHPLVRLQIEMFFGLREDAPYISNK